MANLCCEYKTARRYLLVMNMLILLFSVVFIGVGASSLAYAQSFAAELEDYCIQKCAESNLLQIEPPVGCECKPEPGHTQLPTAVFFTPAVGLIVIGVFSFIAALIGCVGAIRERRQMIYIYCCILCIVMLLQIGFGAAAGAVASGNAPEISGPAFRVIATKYKNFDWQNLAVFFPPACYEGKTEKKNETAPYAQYAFPLCAYDACVPDGSQEEKNCCKSDNSCDTDKNKCITGEACLDTFFRRAGAPVATMCFLPIVLEVIAVVLACVNVWKKPSGTKGDFA